MYKHLNTIGLIVITGVLIALGIGIFKYMYGRPSLPLHAHAYSIANTQAEQNAADNVEASQTKENTSEQVKIQAIKPHGQKRGSGSPTPRNAQPQPNSSTSCTPGGGKCTGTGKSSCCQGWNCCQGICYDTGFTQMCPGSNPYK